MTEEYSKKSLSGLKAVFRPDTGPGVSMIQYRLISFYGYY